MKQFLANHLKNIQGWKTNRKLVAFAVDDYGNIRLASKQAKDNLLKANISLKGRFDHYDALDTREDYEMLFETLASVKDMNCNPAIFTTYALPCNTDYLKTKEAGVFLHENLDVTYKKLAGEFKDFDGAYKLLLQGIDQKLIKPQFHGREHLNVNLFNALLQDKNPQLLANIENQSLAGVPNHPHYPNVGFNQAFAFWKVEETELHKQIIKDGLKRFEEVYGYKSLTFTPPAQQISPDLYGFIDDLGIKSLDKPRVCNRHMGNGKFIKERNILGQNNSENTNKIVRNCVFEPTGDRGLNWVDFTLKQIQSSFFWNKPAIISSHRVNFCGHINPKNRAKGLSDLKQLLEIIVKRWPDVEFVPIDLIAKEL